MLWHGSGLLRTGRHVWVAYKSACGECYPLPAVCCENHDADDTGVYNFHANGFGLVPSAMSWAAFVATNNSIVAQVPGCSNRLMLSHYGAKLVESERDCKIHGSSREVLLPGRKRVILVKRR